MKHIKNLFPEEIKNQIAALGEKSYRAEQIFRAVFADHIDNFDEITTIPKSLREWLSVNFTLDSVKPEKVQNSSDGTVKFLFSSGSGDSVESVLIPEFDSDEEGKLLRNTLCVSSQVGCALDCAFCATGKLKFGRNLEPAEIVDQFLKAKKISGGNITNIVFMGMGEPMHNYDNVMKAVDLLTSDLAPNLNRKKITISTAGVVPGILKLADEPRPVKLALSLHATTNGLRERLMPVAKKWKIDELRKSLEYYYRKTGIPVTYEYIMFDGLNDSLEDARRLARFVRSIPSKVNIIPFHDISFTNPVGIASMLKASPTEKIIAFASTLRKEGANVFIRNSSGLDIDAACGQLAFSSRQKLNSQ